MQKQAPTLGRMAAMVLFTLSCFGLLLYLWLSFGGPVPLRSEGYRFQAKMPESSLLAINADIRMSGLNVGKVRKKTLQRTGGTLVELELDEEFAPIPADSRLELRQKGLLGETYIEITPGTGDGPKLDEGATLSAKAVHQPTEIDELVGVFDRPTRRAFQGWIRELATTIEGRSEDLNDAYGNLAEFASDGSNLLERIDEERPALRALIKNTGIALGAVNERQGQLTELVVNANNVFEAVASRNDSLAEAITIFPTFLEESRLTFNRLETFARETRPLVRTLQPVALKLQPTVRDVAALSPDLKQLFRNLDPLIDESAGTLPDAAKFLRCANGSAPCNRYDGRKNPGVLEALHTYLPELNPVLSYLNYQAPQVADFITIGGGTLAGSLPPAPGESPRHYLRQYSATNARGLTIASQRQNFERGTAYPSANYYNRRRSLGIIESADCKPVGRTPNSAPDLPPCYVQPPQLFDGKFFPRLHAGRPAVIPPPKDNVGTEPPQP